MIRIGNIRIYIRDILVQDYALSNLQERDGNNGTGTVKDVTPKFILYADLGQS